MRTKWDIFCCVVDNFGDIGVTWRLAKQLVAEQNVDVCLWVDELDVFARICPQANAHLTMQVQQGVTIRKWPANWQACDAADVVIEAFACELPKDYIQAMALREKPSLWLNLEYLSAEPWVEGCHGLPSLQSNGLQKYFFFPGFTPKTGGLFKEQDLILQRDRFLSHPDYRAQFLQQLGVEVKDDTLLISLFAYENDSLASWLNCLANGDESVHLLVPEGRVIPKIKAFLGLDELRVGGIYQRGQLTVQMIAFMSQEQYDQLLWSCDFNAVRGEDSFLRAQWAGKPFMWHIYPQEEEAHIPKLDAFLALYCPNLALSHQMALNDMWRQWNIGEDISNNWLTLRENWPQVSKHSNNWCEHQAKQTNIAQALALFYLNWL
ncbi:elongation factor P maturation arginine rhamnosyltransferase EarP [Pseudoalteromonas tunicata]|uniref:elongation factor P maturation arginine rhamnosyltransferase EarP n=1 Tax=Pseudoalteromonas tunicata TaxID=314281 RepID=UPI00273D2D26|nr:elongation factor P maturation arginine rhamnosyltransferase EarP [Pseudoalteromonas tunicata]MDP5214733.1 elongation factor P maturation arginine rhamnosyltransferase EarP [Pseudoalteromonas tunicata]